MPNTKVQKELELFHKVAQSETSYFFQFHVIIYPWYFFQLKKYPSKDQQQWKALILTPKMSLLGVWAALVGWWSWLWMTSEYIIIVLIEIRSFGLSLLSRHQTTVVLTCFFMQDSKNVTNRIQMKRPIRHFKRLVCYLVKYCTVQQHI